MFYKNKRSIGRTIILLILLAILILPFAFYFKEAKAVSSDSLKRVLKNDIKCRYRSISEMKKVSEVKDYKQITDVWTNIKNLLVMAGCKGSSKEIEDKISEELDMVAPFSGHSWPGGGDSVWYRQVGVPIIVGEGIVKGIDSINNPEIKNKLLSNYRELLSVARKSDSGADAATSAYVWLMAYSVFGNNNYFNNFKDLFEKTGAIERGGKIYPDGSYFYHGKHWAIAYGIRNLEDGARILSSIAKLSGNIVSEQVVSDYFNFVKDTVRWVYINQYADPFIVNKFPWSDRLHYGTKNAVSFLSSSLDKFSFLKGHGYENILANIASSFNNYSFSPIGAIAFPFDNFIVARRNDFYASVKLVSPSAPFFEGTSFSSAPGVANILTRSNIEEKLGPHNCVHYDCNNIYLHPHQLINLATIPNDYLNRMYDIKNKNFQDDLDFNSFLKTRWGDYGITTLEKYFALAGEDIKLSRYGYKKSWFILNNKIAVLLSGIYGNNIITYLDDFKPKSSIFYTNKGNYSILSNNKNSYANINNIKVLYYDNKGYYFPSKGDITNIVPEAGYIGVKLKHESNNDAFVFFPNSSKSEIIGYSNNPKIGIIELNEKAHIVKDNSIGFVGASFFSPENNNLISSNNPAYIMYQKKNNKFYFSIYNPNREMKNSLSKTDKDRPYRVWLHYNPLLDYDLNGIGKTKSNGTYTNYEIIIPYRLEKYYPSKWQNLKLISLPNGKTKIAMNLRVRRKLEFETVKDGGVYKITKVSIGINDNNVDKNGLAAVNIKDFQPKKDINGDGIINVADLGIILSNWGRRDREAYDLDQDGRIGGGDAGVLLDKI